MLSRQLTPQRRHIRIHPLRLLCAKRFQIIPIPLQRIRNIKRRLRIPQLKDRVIIKRPVLRLLVLAPDLFALDAEDLHPDAARGGDVVRHDFWCERRVPHYHVVGSGSREHALCEVRGEVGMDDEFAGYALLFLVVLVQ